VTKSPDSVISGASVKSCADLSRWLKSIVKDGAPQRVEVCVVDHKQRPGAAVRVFTYSDTAPLALTAVDELAREAIELCQHDCDQIRDQVIYGVYVRHFLNDLEPCARWLIRLQPSNEGVAS
jgi:hypothetical protein